MYGKLLLTLFMAAGLALAQGGRGRGGGMEDMENMASMRSAPPGRDELLAEKLKLDKDQKLQLHDILMAATQETAPLRSQISNARVQLATAIIEAKSDDSIKQAQQAYSSVAAQLAGIEEKTFAKIYAMLKPNQQSRASQGFELLATMFEQPAGRGRGDGAGRGDRGQRGERER